MGKSNWFCLFMIVFLIPVFLHAEARKQIEISALGGFNLYHQKFSYSGLSPIPEHSPRLGFHLGAAANLHLFSGFSLETDILYRSKKSELVDFLGEDWGDTYYKLDYLALPVLINYRVPISSISLFTTLGLEFDFLLKSQIRDKKNDVVIQPIAYIRSSDVHLISGLGIRRGRFSLMIRYGFGLVNLNTETTNDLVVKNRGIECSISYSVF
jgi:hypothetical protein